MMKVGIQTCTGRTVGIDLQFQIGFNENGNVNLVRCECPRGLFRCHNMAVVLLHAVKAYRKRIRRVSGYEKTRQLQPSKCLTWFNVVARPFYPFISNRTDGVLRTRRELLVL